MKKTINRRLLTLLIIIVIASPVISQDLAQNSKLSKDPFTFPVTTDHSSALPYINDVNGKVLKSFHKTFGEKPGVKWFKNDEGFMAFFEDSSMTTHVYFKTNGLIRYRIHYYSGDLLPTGVRHTVRSNFYDYTIIKVTEVQTDDVSCYLVKMEDDSRIKTVKVTGEEWVVIEELVKQAPSASKAKNF